MNEAFVLRDVAVEAAAYALPRPGAVPPVAMAVASIPAPSVEERLAEAYQEGLRAGRAAQADAVLLERQAAAEKELQQALALAVEEGHAQGLARAADEARLAARDAALTLEQQAKALEAVALSVAGQVEAALDGVEEELVGLCHEVVCRILGDAAASPEGLHSMIGQALRDLQGQPMAIHVHPGDFAVCTAGEALADARVRWVADPSVSLGGALLKGEGGSLDARLETQVRALSDQLAAVRAARRSP